MPISGCENNTSWNGVNYPNENGDVCFSGQPTLTGIEIPYQLGVPNNGYLLNSCTATFGEPQGSWARAGNTFTIAGSASCTYNVSFTFTQNYTVTNVHESCYRGPCTIYMNYMVTGGSGVVTVNSD